MTLPDPLPWDAYRAYLHLLVRLRTGADWRGRVDASDVVQVTLLEAHQAAQELAPLPDERRLAFLRRLLANNLVDALRKVQVRQRHVVSEQALGESSQRLENWCAAQQPSPSARAVGAEQWLQLAAALDSLPEDQRRAVEMKHLQGLTLADIAAALGKTTTAVGGLLFRGMRQLRLLLNPEPGDP